MDVHLLELFDSEKAKAKSDKAREEEKLRSKGKEGEGIEEEAVVISFLCLLHPLAAKGIKVYEGKKGGMDEPRLLGLGNKPLEEV